MITKIKDITKIDAFDSFKWNGSDLKRFNLIYGWNGSGKTTMSRVLKFLERRSIHLLDLTAIDFHLQTTAGTVKAADLTSHALDVRVFNEDFIRENLVFAEGHAKRIVIIGKENIDIKKQITMLEEEHRTKLAEHAKLAKLRVEGAKVDGVLTDAGRAVIQQFLNTPLATDQYYGRSYNKGRVEGLIGNGSITEAKAPLLILAPDQVDAYRDIVKNERHLIPVSPTSIADFAQLFSLADKLIQTPVRVREMATLQDDELRKWVEAGYHLHKKRDSASCLFCTHGLDPSLLDTLAGVFTDELTAVKADIDQMVLRLQTAWTTGGQAAIDSGKLFPDISAAYLASKMAIETESVVISSAIEALCAILKSKQAHLHEGSAASPVIPYPATSVARINDELGKSKALLDEHNRRVARGSDEVTSAARAIELHVIAQMLASKDYFATKKVLATLDGEIGPLKQRIDEMVTEMGEKRAALHDVGIAVDRINELLQDFFGKSQLYLEVIGLAGDMNYVLKSRGKNALHLSEGEKSVLALIYFFVKLEEEGCDKARAMIVVDDPVDSQDGVFLFRTFGLLKRQLNTARQLIVLTHNFEFFNLVRDWLTGTKAVREEAALFLISLDKGDTERAVRIDDLPKLLREHKSEYQYLFALLYQHAQGTQLLDAPLVANVGRKVLEYFAGFKWSCKTTEDFTNIVLTRFVADPDLIKKGIGDFIVKFLHEYSHGQNFARPVSASMLEAPAVTQNILKFIHLADPDHYDRLKSLCE